MKKYLFPILILVATLACEKLAEEETPVCKECYKIRYVKPSLEVMDTLEKLEGSKKLCGGDVPNWKTIPDEHTDTTVIKYTCN